VTLFGLIDISVALSPTTPVWPGVGPLAVSQERTPLGSELVTTSSVAMTVHHGTHIDAPLHFARAGRSIDQLDLDLLTGPCSVLEHKGSGHITAADLLTMGFSPCKRLLIKTRNSEALRHGQLDRDFISLLPDAIDLLMKSKVAVLGVDGFSIGPYGEISDQNHIAFCGAGGIIIEVLDLLDVQPGAYELIALPVKLKGLEAAPARVLLRPLAPEDVTSDRL